MIGETYGGTPTRWPRGRPYGPAEDPEGTQNHGKVKYPPLPARQAHRPVTVRYRKNPPGQTDGEPRGRPGVRGGLGKKNRGIGPPTTAS